MSTSVNYDASISLMKQDGDLVIVGTPDAPLSITAALLKQFRSGRHVCRLVQKRMKECLTDAGLTEHSEAGLIDTFIDESEVMQLVYRCQAIEPLVNKLADPEISSAVDFDPFPQDFSQSLDLNRLIDGGYVVLYQPEPRET